MLRNINGAGGPPLSLPWREPGGSLFSFLCGLWIPTVVVELSPQIGSDFPLVTPKLLL